MNDISRAILDRAIHWRLKLSSEDHDPAQHRAFQAWLNAAPEHAQAWERLELIEQDISRDASPLVRAALIKDKPSAKTGTLKKSLLSVALLAVLSAGWANHQRPLRDWLADQVTASGEQLQVQLDDNSMLRLNSRTSVDIEFNARERRLVLHSGEILVETAHGDTRPFIVETEQGRLQALGTRFLVRESNQTTRLVVLKSAVAAEPAKGPDRRVISAGQQVLITEQGLSQPSPAPMAADAWVHGMLVVENQRLADLVATLAQYRSGYLSVDPQVADLRISGSFPLNNSDLALATLLPSLPVRLEQHSKWWVRVVPAEPMPATAE
ncbi:FecR domain-containing protein [Pseudomonas segetis]|uniref:FecR family protein n=1 Tax=Pseudomonas segetis TaxID=298908 RepID=A0A239I660_9PSED|nr:FecR family protein [Pseudomonas segetis]SNS89009.1 FecR family protein [Pseudomonas segetis]